METNIYLVRHGLTDWNQAGRFQGHTDIPINDIGISQAKELEPLLRTISFDAVFTSDLIRARFTAELITNNRYPLINDERIRELNCGQWEGQTIAQLTAANEPIQAYLLDAMNTHPTGGESIHELCGRVQSFFNDVTEQYQGKNILVVSHAGTVRTAISYLLTNTPTLYNRLIIENCTLNHVVIEATNRTRLKLLNARNGNN